MSQIAGMKETVELAEAKSLLAEKIEDTLSSGNAGQSVLSGGGISQISIEMEPSISPLEWLKYCRVDSKIYWSDRTGKFEMAGAGECMLFTAESYENAESVIARASHLVRSSADGVRIYGGIRFPTSNGNGSDSDWAPFESCRFLVPRFQIIKSGQRAFLTANLRESDRADVRGIIRELEEKLAFENEKENRVSEIISRTDQPTFENW